MPKKGSKPMTKSVPALLARTQFGQILNRVAQNRERFVVTKKGEATAVILGIEDFLQAVVKPSPELAAVQKAAKKRGTNRLSLEEIEKEIVEVRQLHTRLKKGAKANAALDRKVAKEWEAVSLENWEPVSS